MCKPETVFPAPSDTDRETLLTSRKLGATELPGTAPVYQLPGALQSPLPPVPFHTAGATDAHVVPTRTSSTYSVPLLDAPAMVLRTKNAAALVSAETAVAVSVGV